MSIVNCLTLSLADVPDDDGWLTSNERSRLAGLTFAKRRNDWRLGRWTAKQAVSRFLGRACDFPSLAELEIRAAADGAPEVLVGGLPGAVSVSISHSRGRSFCVAAGTDAAVGCDIEWIEPRDDKLIQDYFTAGEAALVESWPPAERAAAFTLVWCAKESALKSLREGLRRDTRSVIASIPSAGDKAVWNPLTVRCSESSRIFYGWWRIHSGFVYAVTSNSRDATVSAFP